MRQTDRGLIGWCSQIVESFRNKRTIPVEICDQLVEQLEQRRIACVSVESLSRAIISLIP
jgi:hypothetical protein